MIKTNREFIGYTCAYTPLAIIDAVGFMPYRILPIGDHPDQAGKVLHDNLCPQVKKILDRGLSGNIPNIHGMVFINSCDAMRRLADAWQKKLQDKVILIDLPVSSEKKSILFFSDELRRLNDTLSEWSGNRINDATLSKSIEKYNEVFRLLSELRKRAHADQFKGGAEAMQAIYNRTMTETVDSIIDFLKQKISEPKNNFEKDNNTPIYLFGNVLPDPEVFKFIRSCGVKIVDDDLCTGSRTLPLIDLSGDDSIYEKLSRGILNSPPCARTFKPDHPGILSREVVERAKACGAKGVIGHVVKYCDPYLHRIPIVRDALRKEGIPFLFLEGDCTLRSIEQHRTRIEAFIEMLK